MFGWNTFGRVQVVPDRGWRVGFFNLGSGRVQVLEKIIGSGLGSGIGYIYGINRVLSGIENLDQVFFGYNPDKGIFTWFN